MLKPFNSITQLVLVLQRQRMRTVLVLLLRAISAGAASIKFGPSGDVVHANVDTLKLTIRWSNNFTAVAELSDDQKDDCIFPGRFVKDDESVVLVTGCTPDELSVQFQSSKFGDFLFTVSKDGKIVNVGPDDSSENGEDYHFYDELLFQSEDFPKVSPGINGRVRRDGDFDAYEDFYFVSDDLDNLPELDDYEVDEELLPSTVELQLNIYLDPAFRQQHGRRASTIARQIVGQAGLLMNHHSLTTKIELVHGNRFYNSNKHLKFSSKSIATGDFYTRLPKLLQSPMTLGGHPIAHVYLTVADSSFVKGVALGGSICAPQNSKQGKPRAIISWNNDVSTSAVTMAHEVGHVMGMFHDFKKKSDRTRSTCAKVKTGKYILNYGNSPRRTSWSACSNDDFKAYYFRVRFGMDDEYCLKEIGSSGGGNSCSSSEFQCGRGGRCIPARQRCDGFKRHCPGGDDELDCPFDF